MNRWHGVVVLIALFALTGAARAQEVWYYEAPPKPRKGPIHWLCDRLARCSCGYGKTHHDFGCTGCKGEAIFVWGSCWEFFEEPCRSQHHAPHPAPVYPVYYEEPVIYSQP